MAIETRETKPRAGALSRRNVSLGIVCPMANESGSAARFVREALAACGDLRSAAFYAVVDNASHDGTRGVLADFARTEPRLRVVWAPENRSVAGAYLRGYREALGAGHDFILEIDAGFSHLPADIPQFLDAMEQGYDCVFGSRFMPGGRIVDSPAWRRFLSYGGTLLTNFLVGTRLRDMTSGFELFSREALQLALARGIHSRAHFFQTEIKFHCRHLNVAEVPITYSAATPGVGGGALADAFLNLYRLWKARWRDEPIR
jgi:dolichol-phosphate mannosyltransferase